MGHKESNQTNKNHLPFSQSGLDGSCSQDQIGLFLKIGLATGNHVSQDHL